MITRSSFKVGVAAAFVAALAAAAAVPAQQQKQEDLTVTPCDGGEPVAVPGYKAGERLTADRAQRLADMLMAGWLSRQPSAMAAAWVRERDTALAEAAQAAPPPSSTQSPGEQPVEFSARDQVIWQKELAREIEYGNKVFHDDKEIGSAEGIACAMCHPNASNTHPETYPKFQTQLKRVALLRDMINWCIENPIKGKRLEPDDPKMRALEAYILSQRKGAAIEPGKH